MLHLPYVSSFGQPVHIAAMAAFHHHGRKRHEAALALAICPDTHIATVPRPQCFVLSQSFAGRTRNDLVRTYCHGNLAPWRPALPGIAPRLIVHLAGCRNPQPAEP